MGVGERRFLVETLGCFTNMIGNKFKMDAILVLTLLSVYGKLGDVKKGKKVHG